MSYNPDRINIHELTVEEPEKREEIELSFDPEKLLTEYDWNVLKNWAEGFGDGQTAMSYASLKILDKNKLPTLDNEKEKEITNNVLGSTIDLAWMSYGSPPPDFIKISDDAFQEILASGNKRIQEYKEAKNMDWRHFVEPVAWLTVLGHRPELSADDFRHIEAELESQKAKGNGGYMIEMGAAMAIIYPEYPLHFTIEQGEKMANYLKRQIISRAEAEWYKFTAMAKITADKCREVAARKNLKSEMPPIPEAKQF